MGIRVTVTLMDFLSGGCIFLKSPQLWQRQEFISLIPAGMLPLLQIELTGLQYWSTDRFLIP